ncbi:MAG: Fur family transcriptional regulator [Desulfuromonas sp.]|nr:MAG: Fur family transcriptional regulator [Desulfuromonas sp.]
MLETATQSASFACKRDDHEHCIASALATAERLCAERGVRLTRLRRKVLELVWSNHRPVGAYELLEQLKSCGPAAPPTVYRALDFLQTQGLVHRLASLNAFIGCSHPQAEHTAQFLICRRCRNLAELADDGLSNAVAASARTVGFQAEEQMVEIVGLCEPCRRKGEG